jgi:hypothetical protein
MRDTPIRVNFRKVVAGRHALPQSRPPDDNLNDPVGTRKLAVCSRDAAVQERDARVAVTRFASASFENSMAPAERDLDRLLALALAAAEAKRPKFERRSGGERRSGIDRRTGVATSSPAEDERRTGRGRRRGRDRRIFFTALPDAP